MKRTSLLLLVLLFGLTTYAQVKSKYLAGADIKNLFWKKEVADGQVPLEWQKENAVIMYREYGYELQPPRTFTPIAEIYHYHYRIMVQNADGIKELSEIEIELPKSSVREVYVAARVIKANTGRIIEVEDEHIVHLEAKAGSKKLEKLKIAVPQLEAGDVIDYFHYYKFPAQQAYSSYSSGTTNYFLTDKYPILFQQIIIPAEKTCSFSSLSFNGAPEFKLTKKDKDHKTDVYVLTDTNREARKEERWRLDSKDLPYAKFRVQYTMRLTNRNDKGYDDLAQSATGHTLDQYLIGYINEERKRVELTKAGKALRRATFVLCFRPFLRSEDDEVAEFKKWIRKSQKKSVDPVEVARNAFEAYRLQETGHRYEYDYLSKEEANFDRGWSDLYSVLIFSRALKLTNIKHELVLTYSKSFNQSISDKPNLNQMKIFVKVSNGKESVYLSSFNALTVAGEFHPSFEGAEARVIAVPQKGRKVHLIQKDYMPEFKGTNHYVKTNMEVFFNEEQESLEANRVLTLAGDSKEYWQEHMVKGFNYLDYARINELKIRTHDSFSRKEYNNLPQTRAEVKERDENKLNEWYEKELQREFATDQLKLQEIRLQQAGIWSDAAELIYKDRFVIDGFATKAGPDYLIEVGKLIGEQVKLTEEEKNEPRQSMIYFENARLFHDEVLLTIPDGYVVSGLESLNMNVSNKAGQFEVKASQISANRIKVSVLKVYREATLPKEAWADVIVFTEAANEFYKKQLLLKKANMSRN